MLLRRIELLHPNTIELLSTGAMLVLIGVGAGRSAVRAQTPRATAPALVPGRADALGARALDLTYSFDEQTIYWPTDRSFRETTPKGFASRDTLSRRLDR